MDNRGMMTVEAACIVPIILMIIVIEIFFGIFLIDMSSVKSETIRLADETADVWKTDGNLIDGTYKPQQLLSRNKNFLRHNNRGQLIGKAKARLAKRISTRLSGTTLCKNGVSFSGDKVSASASIRFLIPVWGSREYMGTAGWTFTCKEKAVISNEEDKCKRILQSISDLIQEIDDYMLNLNYVELSPEYIYESADGTMQWIYSPKTYRENLQARIETFFEWMLIQINYEDDKAVRYIYKVYNKVRKLGFSKELLENYLCTEEKEEEYIKRNSYEEFFRKDLAEERVKEPEREYFKEADKTAIQKINAKKPSHQKFIYISLLSILGIASIAAIVFESICIVSGITKGFTEILLRYCIGGILFIAAFVLAILKCFRELRRIRKAPETCLADYNKKNRENDNAEQYNRRGNKAMSVVKTEAEWNTETDWNTEGEGTTILSLEKESFYPMLRDMETGIVSIIKSCPFYIGSAEGVNQLKISDKTVSREHAVILEAFYENGGEGYILRDLDSTNGTWIDGRKIKKGSQERLQEGATVRFAQKEYRFLLEHTTIQ